MVVSFREPTGRLLLDGISIKIPVISMLHNDPDEIFAGAPAAEKKALLKVRTFRSCFRHLSERRNDIWSMIGLWPFLIP